MPPLSTWKPKEVILPLLWLAGAWTIAVLAGLTWNMLENRQAALDMALTQARISFERDVFTRRWNTSFGEAPVPPPETTALIPSVSFISGKESVPSAGNNPPFISPARHPGQLHELACATGGDAGHLTSLKPIRQENAPDEWEAAALRGFEKGETEASTLFTRDGQDALRFMRPLITGKDCLNCHARQGYSEGMVLGGLSVIVPVPPWNKMRWPNHVALFCAHFLFWALGIGALTVACHRIVSATWRREDAELRLAEANRELEDKVAERTAEYEKTNAHLHTEIAERLKVQGQLESSVRQWRETFDLMSDLVSVHDNEMRIVRVNKTLASLFGKRPEELIGKRCYETIHNTREPWPSCPHLRAIEKRQTITEEIEEPYLNKTLLVTCSPIIDANGGMSGTVHVARDITNKKREEKEKEALLKKLQTSLDEIKSLRGILPFCCFCKKIRDDRGYWERVDVYIHKYSGADISHSICPECMKEHYPEEYKALYLKNP